MAGADGPAHLVSLKVMRVSRPSLASAWQPFYSSSPSFSAHSSASLLSLQGSKPLQGHPKTLRDLTHATEILMLPAAFGFIQLGETFSSCLSANNEVRVDIEDVHLKMEMQTATTKVTLAELGGTDHNPRLGVGGTLETVVHHEIKELGQHVLACTVTYRLPQNARPIPGASEDSSDINLMTFRKFYKFVVANPLSVKTKVHVPKSPSAFLNPAERDKIFLEVHIQNLTPDSICFEKMQFECAEGWNVADGNFINSANPKINNTESVFSGALALMKPQDMRQYIYILIPKSISDAPTVHPPGTVIPLGRLDISWRSSFGEPGRLLTSVLSRRIPPLQPQPQQPPPVSALPSYLKRNVIGATPSRPQSPRSTMSRPNTPPPFRPASPSQNRPSLSSSSVPASSPLPQSPQQTLAFIPPPDLELNLIVRHIPRSSIALEKPFTISYAVIVSSPTFSAKPFQKRQVTLAVQHLQHPKVAVAHAVTSAALTTLPVATSKLPPDIEPFSPHLPSSGASTPLSSTATFNYPLAHQKILAASQRQTFADYGDHVHPTAAAATNDQLSTLLPPPFFDGPDELRSPVSGAISFVGASTIIFPPTELELMSTSNTETAPKLQAIQEFDLTFFPLRKGFHTVGGLRFLLIEDVLLSEHAREEKKSKLKRAQTLKEYEVIAEVWVSASSID